MATDPEESTVPPSEQRGGTTPDDQEALDKGDWAGKAAEGIVPAEQGGSDAPREMLGEDPELDPSGGDNADATTDGGANLPQDAEPDLKDAAAAVRHSDLEAAQ